MFYETGPQCDQRIEKQFGPSFQKSSQKLLPSQIYQTIDIKAQFGSPKHLHRTTFETLKSQEQNMFLNSLLR
jgi:hypothetical protein